MTWHLFYYDEVISDVNNAKKWYFEQQGGLEKRFAEDVKQCISKLKRNPFIYDQLVVIAISHQHRQPDFVKSRH